MQGWKTLLFIIWIGCLLGISKTTKVDVEMWNWELLCNYSTSGQIVNLKMFPHKIHHYALVEAWSWAQCATHSTSSPPLSTGCPAQRATRGRPTQPYTIFTGSQLGSSNSLPLVSFGIFSSKYPPPLLWPWWLFLASIVAESQNKVMTVREGWQYQIRWIFGKFPKGGAGIFNPKNYIADFGNFKQGFSSMKLIQKSNFRIQGMFFQQLYWEKSKRDTLWSSHTSLRDRSGYQNGWISGKVPNSSWPPPP